LSDARSAGGSGKDKIRVAVAGAAGRMGGAVLRRLAQDERFQVAASMIRADSPLVGQSVALDLLHLPEFSADSDGWRNPRVLFDASRAEAVQAHAEQATRDGVGMVIAVTGLAPATIQTLDLAARRVPVLVSANLSLGVAVLAQLVREAARRLPRYDVEIVEAHHAAKKDAPSGTALWLAQEAAMARGWPWPGSARTGRTGATGPRPAGEIGVSSIRAGSVTGEHRVWLGGPGEHLELVHVAESRDCFASGALEAIAFIAGASPGRYTMEDVTGST
jgi:4-hydroxy-tetrahydrodipicolinate reductase